MHDRGDILNALPRYCSVTLSGNSRAFLLTDPKMAATKLDNHCLERFVSRTYRYDDKGKYRAFPPQFLPLYNVKEVPKHFNRQRQHGIQRASPSSGARPGLSA